MIRFPIESSKQSVRATIISLISFVRVELGGIDPMLNVNLYSLPFGNGSMASISIHSLGI